MGRAWILANLFPHEGKVLFLETGLETIVIGGRRVEILNIVVEFFEVDSLRRDDSVEFVPFQHLIVGSLEIPQKNFLGEPLESIN